MEQKKEDKQNKNKAGLVGLVLIVLLIVGFFYFRQGQITKIDKTQINQVKTVNQNQKNNQVITSIKDALTASMSVKCQYQTEKGDKVTVYLKNKKIRADNISASNLENSVIYTDEKIWFWEPKTKKGIVFSTKFLKQQTSKEQTLSQSIPDRQEIINKAEEYRQKCQKESLPDSLFMPPKDVKFDDFESMMKELMNNQ